jgi:hypothetical protein
MIVFCVVFCRSVIVLFLLAIALPALVLGDLKTLLALFLKQKRVRLHVRGFCLLHLVSNDVHVKLHTSFFLLHLLSYGIKLHTSFQTKLNPIGNCTRIFFTLYRVSCNFTLPLQALGPIGYDCYRSLWNKLEITVRQSQIK